MSNNNTRSYDLDGLTIFVVCRTSVAGDGSGPRRRLETYALQWTFTFTDDDYTRLFRTYECASCHHIQFFISFFIQKLTVLQLVYSLTILGIFAVNTVNMAVGRPRQMNPLFARISGLPVFAKQIDRNKTCWCADVRAGPVVCACARFTIIGTHV